MNCRVVDEYIWPVFTSKESVALAVVKPEKYFTPASGYWVQDSNRHTLSTVFQRDLGSKQMLEKRLSVMKDTIARWIQP
jgi:hypothetical protein